MAHPISSFRGVESWEDMEKIWHHTFYNELRCAPKEAPSVLITEYPYTPKQIREKMVTILFETFNVKSLSIPHSATLTLYAGGRITGLVCDSGECQTSTTSIYEGILFPYVGEKEENAGSDVTYHLQKLLLEIGESLTSTAEFEILRDIK